jgi:hypothetical protein
MLFINSKLKQCGIYQYGFRVYTIIKNYIDIEYHEVETLSEYLEAIAPIQHRHVLINYHSLLFEFLDSSYQCPSIKYYYIFHEGAVRNIRDGYMFNNDPSVRNGIPRPLPMICNKDKSLTDLSNPIIGSFGFGSPDKGFDSIVKRVQDEFDTARIRFVIPFNETFDINGIHAKNTADKCRSIVTKPGIDLDIRHDFLSDDEIVDFLNSNDINMFLYAAKKKGRACSSVIDFAICANTPIAISDSEMFRHIYRDEICVYKHSIREIIEFGIDHIKTIRDNWSHEKLANAIRMRLQF